MSLAQQTRHSPKPAKAPGLFFILLFLGPVLWAQEPDLKLEGLRFYSWFPSGAEISLSLSDLGPWDGFQADAELLLGAGFEEETIPRNMLNGDPVPPEKFNVFTKGSINWALGILPSLRKRDDGKSLLGLFLYHRGLYAVYQNDLPDTVFKDANGIFESSFLAGIYLDFLRESGRVKKQGFNFELSSEFAPGFLNPKSDYWRFSFQGEAWLPVFALEKDGLELLDISLGAFLASDYSLGSAIPIHVNNSFGGRRLGPSLGSSVRGYIPGSFDTGFKTKLNTELRFTGPSVFFPDFNPFFILFADTGYLDGYHAGKSIIPASGTMASLGISLGVDAFSVLQLQFVTGIRLMDDLVYNLPRGGFAEFALQYQF